MIALLWAGWRASGHCPGFSGTQFPIWRDGESHKAFARLRSPWVDLQCHGAEMGPQKGWLN